MYYKERDTIKATSKQEENMFYIHMALLLLSHQPHIRIRNQDTPQTKIKRFKQEKRAMQQVLSYLRTLHQLAAYYQVPIHTYSS